eukprot:749117-Hanusia_phi.AAC.4
MVEVAVGLGERRMEVEEGEEKEPTIAEGYVKPDEDGGSQAEKDRPEEVDAEAADKDDAERGGDGENQGTDEQEVAFPYARIKRIMRKNPDKKKNYSRETIHAMAVCTVSVILVSVLIAEISCQELFLIEISKQAHSLTMDRKRKTMQLQDIGNKVHHMSSSC